MIRHSIDTLMSWARRLSMFRFVGAAGGFANDGDALIVALRYHSADALVHFFERAGIAPRIHHHKPKAAVIGQTYSVSELQAFPSLIPGTRWIEQPGYCRAFGVEGFVWCSEDAIAIRLSSQYEVTDDDVTRAEALEARLREVALERVEPPVDDPRCICPKHHPEYFESAE